MASAIDHIVIAVPDLDGAVAELTAALGLAFTGGGRHAGLGTVNRIAFLGDAYLELMAVDDAAEALGWAVGAAAVEALKRGGGFTTYALLDDGIRTTVARLQANGSRIGPVIAGSRERPDGEQVAWWTATPPVLGPGHAPFLIKHLYAGGEWGADALAARRAFAHPIGCPVRLAGLEIASPDPEALAAECLAQLGIGFQSVGEFAATAIGPHRVRLLPAVDGAPQVTVALAAAVGAPRAVEAHGVRIEVRPATAA